MSKEKNWISEHPALFIGIISIILIGIIAIVFLATDNTVEDDSMTATEYSYIVDIQEILLIQSETGSIIQMIITGTLDGSISYYEASVLFESAFDVFSSLEISLNDMHVPYEFMEYHEHIKNSVKFAKEATSLMSYGMLYVDADLIDDANIKVQLSTDELNKANSVLELL